MTRTSFNLFAQRYFSTLLSEFGTVYLNEPVPRDPKLRVYKLPSRNNVGTQILGAVTQRNDRIMISPEVIGEAELVDVLFEPDEQKARTELGLLGELLSVPCIIETLRWLPTVREVRTCMRHWLSWKVGATGGMIPVDQDAVDREIEEEEDIDDKLLLIVLPSTTPTLLETWGASPDSRNVPGVYQLAPAFCTMIVVVSELPQDTSTLWLRLLGRGRTQRLAIQELMRLELRHPIREAVLHQFKQWYELMIQGQMGKESKLCLQVLSQIES
ncbi:MAG: hypothetical protein MUC48_24755 [Leptolyngbya sp. Prado105]|nr:hypothetical protein [Leptolyngbya sp. Prado105]